MVTSPRHLIGVHEQPALLAFFRASERREGGPESGVDNLVAGQGLDVEHAGFFEGLMNRLDDADDQAAVVHAAKRFYVLYGAIFRSLRESPQARAEAA